MTSNVPSTCGSAASAAVIVVEFTTVTPVAMPRKSPIITVAPILKPDPAIVTATPPDGGPKSGVIDDTVGGPTYV